MKKRKDKLPKKNCLSCGLEFTGEKNGEIIGLMLNIVLKGVQKINFIFFVQIILITL